MIKQKYPYLILTLSVTLFVFGCSSDKNADDPQSAIVKEALEDPSMQQFTKRPGLDSEIGFDTTKMDDYRLVGRLDYDNGSPRRLIIGLDPVDKAPMLTISYDESGNRLEEIETYGKQRNGRFVQWYPSGNLKTVSYFKLEKQRDTSYLYWENGYLKQIVTYSDGLKNGLWEQYTENGIKIKQGLYANDSLDGAYTAWDQNGRLEYKGFYKNDKMSGKWEKYYPSGRIKAVTNYEDGLRNGMYVVWDEMGFPMAEDFYIKGEKHERPDSIPRAQAINPPQIKNPYGDQLPPKTDSSGK